MRENVVTGSDSCGLVKWTIPEANREEVNNIYEGNKDFSVI